MMQMASSSFDDVNDKMMWLAFSKDKLQQFLGNDNDRLRKKRISQNIKTTAIYNSNSGSIPTDKNSVRLIIDEKKYPCPGDVAVYGEKIRLSSYDDQIGIIIENRDIAETLKSIFKLAIKGIKNKKASE
jgi:hypothetical protein